MDSNALDLIRRLADGVKVATELASVRELPALYALREEADAYLAGVKPPAGAVDGEVEALTATLEDEEAAHQDTLRLLGERDAEIAALKERLARAGQSVPSGLDPTESMIEEGAKAIVGFYSEELWISDSEKDRNAVRTARMEAARCWRAMRSAAPPPQASGQTFADGVAEKVRILATEALASGDTRQPWSDTAIKIEALIGLLPTPPSVSAQHKEAGE
jgi:hypothetical protein